MCFFVLIIINLALALAVGKTQWSKRPKIKENRKKRKPLTRSSSCLDRRCNRLVVAALGHNKKRLLRLVLDQEKTNRNTHATRTTT